MVLKILKSFVKVPLFVGMVGYLQYSCHDDITRMAKEVKYFNYKAEEGFVDKVDALDLRIAVERNSRNNLETYIEINDIRLPVYARDKGIMVGDANYNYGNFTLEERASLCACRNPRRNSSSNGVVRFLHGVYKFFAD